jgi:hypothetical protein
MAGPVGMREKSSPQAARRMSGRRRRRVFFIGACVCRKYAFIARGK